MLNVLSVIAERRISEAVRNGELDIKGWENKPLPQEDNSLIPPELRMAYKILKNSGFLPPEIETRKEIHKLEELIASTEDEHTRVKQLKKLEVLLLKVKMNRNRPVNLDEHEEYFRKVTEKVSVKGGGKIDSMKR